MTHQHKQPKQPTLNNHHQHQSQTCNGYNGYDYSGDTNSDADGIHNHSNHNYQHHDHSHNSHNHRDHPLLNGHCYHYITRYKIPWRTFPHTDVLKRPWGLFFKPSVVGNTKRPWQEVKNIREGNLGIMSVRMISVTSSPEIIKHPSWEAKKHPWWYITKNVREDYSKHPSQDFTKRPWKKHPWGYFHDIVLIRRISHI